MTFLQPFILWGLPLVLVPVLIHLINRMRHRPQPWAATRFLLTATRSSISHQKLRQFLILLFRMLAVLALVMFLSRPLVGGWLGWVFSAAPDAIIILLDRSASMERQAAGTTRSLREAALETLTQAARPFEESSHLVLIDSALRSPQELASASSFASVPMIGPTDTAADLPALFRSAMNWVVENRAGTAEFWVASDLQASNWQTSDPRWEALMKELSGLPQQVRVRLLTVPAERASNTSVSLQEVIRRQRGGQPELHFTLDLQRNTNLVENLPLTVNLDGSPSQAELRLEGSVYRWRHAIDLGGKLTGGWGSFELPADLNRRDNQVFFVYGPEQAYRALVVSEDPASSRFLRFAAASLHGGQREGATVVSALEFEGVNLEDKTLVVWQGMLPRTLAADRLRGFIEEGGAVIFFPPGELDSQRFMGIAWGDLFQAPAEAPFRVLRWDEDQGPLARTDEGFSLPLAETLFFKRQALTGANHLLAAFDNRSPLLARQSLGRGEFYFCAALPIPEWSSLGEGTVLVPMLQRLLQTGSRRLQRDSIVACGEMGPADRNLRWVPVHPAETRDARLHAGIYQSGQRLVAVNRPASEDSVETAELEQVRALFGEVPFQFFQETSRESSALEGEFWRFFLFGMLIFLLTEAVLILPARKPVLTHPSVSGARPMTGASPSR